MKNFQKISFGLFLSLFFLFLGCGKDSPEPSVEPTIFVSPGSITITYGDSTTITVIANNNVSTIATDIPGHPLIIVGENKVIRINTPKLFESVTYHFTGNGENGKKTQELKVVINVSPLSVEAPTVDLISNHTTITKGESIILTWSTTGVIDSTYSNVPGISGSSGSFEYFPEESMTVSMTVYNKSGNFTDEVYIIVNIATPPPTDSEKFLCNYGAWKMVGIKFQQNPSSPWVEDSVRNCIKDNLLSFYFTPPNNTWTLNSGEIRCDNEPEISYGDWFLRGSIINMPSPKRIVTLNRDTLVWKYNPGNQQSATMEIYAHPAKKNLTRK